MERGVSSFHRYTIGFVWCLVTCASGTNPDLCSFSSATADCCCEIASRSGSPLSLDELAFECGEVIHNEQTCVDLATKLEE